MRKDVSNAPFEGASLSKPPACGRYSDWFHEQLSYIPGLTADRSRIRFAQRSPERHLLSLIFISWSGAASCGATPPALRFLLCRLRSCRPPHPHLVARPHADASRVRREQHLATALGRVRDRCPDLVETVGGSHRGRDCAGGDQW